jgi:hypothetical protein
MSPVREVELRTFSIEFDPTVFARILLWINSEWRLRDTLNAREKHWSTKTSRANGT